jgi:hypothetical protein
MIENELNLANGLININKIDIGDFVSIRCKVIGNNKLGFLRVQYNEIKFFIPDANDITDHEVATDFLVIGRKVMWLNEVVTILGLGNSRALVVDELNKERLAEIKQLSKLDLDEE